MPQTDCIEQILNRFGRYTLNGRTQYCGRGPGAPQFPPTQDGEMRAASAAKVEEAA